MTTEKVHYIDPDEAFWLHIDLMRVWGELRCGIDQRNLLESALARPKHAAVYDNADIITQAATLVFGLIKNHPWLGGNKRTATYIADTFLQINGYIVEYTPDESYEMVLGVESGNYSVLQIDEWYRKRTDIS